MTRAPTRGVVGWRISLPADWTSASHQDRAGRWHYAGEEVLYLSRTPELAILEALVHHRPGDGPYHWYCVTGPRVASRTVAGGALPADWRDRALVTRRIGRAWLRARAHTVLRVPSAVCAHAFNLLVNPALAKPPRWRMHDLGPFRFDRRLVVRRAPADGG